MKFGWILLALAALGLNTSWGQMDSEGILSSDPFQNENIIAIQKLHDQSAAGDKDTTDLLIATLESLIKNEPENQLYHVYLGSAFTLKSRDVFPGPSKLRYLKDGLKGMDAAVKKDPRNPSVRFIRAVNNYHLPAFINRKDNARKDFETLLKQIESDSQQLDARTIQAIYYFAGLAFEQTKRDQQARETWMKGLALQADAGLNEKIQQELSDL
jgi:hypothetical protein